MMRSTSRQAFFVFLIFLDVVVLYSCEKNSNQTTLELKYNNKEILPLY